MMDDPKLSKVKEVEFRRRNQDRSSFRLSVPNKSVPGDDVELELQYGGSISRALNPLHSPVVYLMVTAYSP